MPESIFPGDGTFTAVKHGNTDFKGLFRKQVFYILRPFHQTEATAVKVVIQPDVESFGIFGDAVEIKVIDRFPGGCEVFVDYGECRGSDRIIADSELTADCSDECGLAGPHGSVERHKVTAFCHPEKICCRRTKFRQRPYQYLMLHNNDKYKKKTMLTQIKAAKCIGTEAVLVTVETDIDHGIGIHLVGLADAAVKESLLRTVTAMESLGFRIPGKKIVINLAPADLRKNGSGYDLPIAIGIMASSGKYSFTDAEHYLMMGELGLDGSVRPIEGALPYVELAVNLGMKGVILPAESALEAAEITEIPVYGISSLKEALSLLQGEDCTSLLASRIAETLSRPDRTGALESTVDFSDIIGQEAAKRAVEIAAAGGHNIIMIGAPGSGKSSLAKAMAGILPPMSREESLETSRIYSVAGLRRGCSGLVRQRPFRSPHYSASMAAIIGGGAGDNIVPGEVTLADNGVLFLDEMPQMPKSVLESLRGPIEDRKVTISRLKNKVEFPSSFTLVAAANPCPCGYYGEGDRCRCTPSQRAAYLARLSGPIMDRIDLQVWMHPVPTEAVMHRGRSESSREVAKRVSAARRRQAARFAGEGICTNAEMTNRQTERHCPLDDECRSTLEKIMENTGMSLRAWYRIIKVARTIADLEDEERIRPGHIMEAAGYRLLDRGKV